MVRYDSDLHPIRIINYAYTMGKWAKSEWHFQGPIAWLWR